MPPNAGDLPPQSPLRIKQDGKFYERLLTKESSLANPSFRHYWAEPGSVPFVWESQPGTPKDVYRLAAALPAITPPPSYSYQLRHSGNKAASHQKSRSRSKAKNKRWYRFKRIRISFIADIFRRLTLGKPWQRSPSSVQASSSSRWLFSSVATERGEQQCHEEPAQSTVLCFRMMRLRGFRNRSRVDGWA